MARSLERCEEFSAEQPGENSNREKEARSAPDPFATGGGEASPWNHAVYVRVMHQRLGPGVEHREEPDLCAQVLWIARYAEERLRRAAEEERVEKPFVSECQRGDLLRDREHHVEVLDGEQLLSARIE